MARKPRESDLRPGKYIHYWGQNRQILRVYKNFLILSDTYSFTGEIQVDKGNEFLLCFDEIKKDVFGREIK
ncbi:hypothetical protein GTQ43_20910 [Nostoc sp. KVJ3]|uniref:hypothetical protein n=1 Tax=Nostoc sp. KVJ3 TaxID=457945 RepID=UPI0022374688|nr:hypothetical protein [Nostoc sp. KVJ3]MCW5315614.1 hypothetical protein [Nostoc sp. KVJ3]MCW5316186.1 hypothetical protein [Nostoc sp. KVJ3]